MKIKKSNFQLIGLLLILYAASFCFLYFIGNQQLEEVYPSLQFFADSNTYIKIYNGDMDNGAIIRVDGNYLGPMMVLTVFQGNNYLISAFNYFVFACSVMYIANLLNVNSLKVGLLLLISPLTISNLLSVNKEIFLYPFFALALNAYIRRSMLLLLSALCVSLLVRWQLVIFYVVLILIISFRGLQFSRRGLLFALLISMSLAYLAIMPAIQSIVSYVEASNESFQEGGSGIFEFSVSVQNAGFYFLIFPLKMLHLLFGMGLKFVKLLNPIDIYNDFFVSGHCAIVFVVFLNLLFKRKISLRSDLLFVSAVYLVVFCITPVFAPRYLYFVFVLWVMVLMGASLNMDGRRGGVVIG